jgi:DNA-directed RNA polymerase subunit delta
LSEGVEGMAQNNVSEKPVLEKIYESLLSGKQPKTFYDLVNEIADERLQGDAGAEYLARLYTNMNLDGRFLSIGENFWGLRAWYPVEQRTEEAASKIATKRKRRKDDFGFDGFEDDYDELEDDLDEDLFEEDDDTLEETDDDDVFDDDDDETIDSFEDDDDEFIDDDDDSDDGLDDDDDDDDVHIDDEDETDKD